MHLVLDHCSFFIYQTKHCFFFLLLLESGACLKTITGHESGLRALINNKEGEVISASADRTIRLWHIESGQCLRTLTGHESSIFTIIKGKDGRLFSAGHDRSSRKEINFKKKFITNISFPLFFLFKSYTNLGSGPRKVFEYSDRAS